MASLQSLIIEQRRPQYFQFKLKWFAFTTDIYSGNLLDSAALINLLIFPKNPKFLVVLPHLFLSGECNFIFDSSITLLKNESDFLFWRVDCLFRKGSLSEEEGGGIEFFDSKEIGWISMEGLFFLINSF